MNKEEFVAKVKKWYKDYFNVAEEKVDEEIKYYEDYINGAISHIENGANEIVEFNNLTYIISIA